MGKIRLHKNCGGAIKGNRCTRCGKVFGLKDKLFGNYSDEVDDPRDKFSPKRYKDRIRQGKDIWK